MAKLARLPRLERTAATLPAEGRAPRLRTRYYAFLSYSHKDKELADWLHRELEKFRVPHSLAGKLTSNGVVPRRLSPVFRDQHDLSAGDDLAVEIEAALAASQFLVVLCSPTAATSRWTNLEIESFKRTRPEGCVLAAVVAGEPFASDIPGREDDECFPPALRYKYDRRGHRTSKRAEPLAADFRAGGEGRRIAFLKLVAGMLGVGLDELVQREQTRRQRRLALLAAASLGGMAITSTLAVTAIQARDAARDQRRQAEGLIGFMLGDLKDKLEPIGRLDALDGVGSRVLAYYQQQGTTDLTDSALSQRSRALSLMGEVAVQRGDLDGASRLYREAMAGTAEAVRRKPGDPQRIFDHAQNVFWIGQIAIYKGSLKQADVAFHEYKRLADRMVAIDPDSIKWRMEVYNADANLGGLLSEERRFAEASAQWGQVFRMISALTSADPKNRDYRQSLVESIAWYADAEMDAGHLANATALRERDVALLSQMAAGNSDIVYRQKLIPATRQLGILYANQGRIDLGIKTLRSAADQADQLAAREPDNSMSLEYGFKAKFDLAALLLATGARDDAAGVNNAACTTVTQLLAKDPKVPSWRVGLWYCWTTKAQLALASGNSAAAVQAAERATEVAKTVKTTDPADAAFKLARALQLLGDARNAAGDRQGAQSAWASALTALPQVTAETPEEMQHHALILERVNRGAEAQRINDQLSAIGYRRPLFKTV